MKAALYVRVSTDDQAREGYSIPAQLKALIDYCKRESIEIYKTYVDEGQSGVKENRPKFQEMLKEANKKVFDIILVHKYDRFARKIELSRRIKTSLRKSGINVVSITEPIEDSPIGFFQEGIMELLAEYYIKNLSQEVKKGQSEKISQGKPCNMLPYGYKNINGAAVIIEDQANVVRKIFELYNQGCGSQQISNYLNDRGIPTMKNGLWNSSQINYILRNNAYAGCLKWGGRVIKNALPAIISEELFSVTQSKINIKLRTNRAEYYNKFLLLGLLRCGYCGSPMRITRMYPNGNKNGKVYYMYNCRQARYSKKRCGFSKHYQHQDIEKYVIKNIEDIITGIRDVEHIIDYTTNIVDERMAKIKNELERVKKAYLAEVFTLEEYKNERQRLEAGLHLLEMEKSEEQKKFKLKNKIKTYYDKFKCAKTIQEKKVFLQDIIESIKLSKGAIDIYFKA
jgi:DNA invertase Pin-like site-specific DNA recombinase